MEPAKGYKRHERIEHIIELIKKFAKSDFKARSTFWEKNDDLDAILIELDTLGKKMTAQESYIEENKLRIKEIVEVLLKLRMKDFSQKITLSENQDELDAIAFGINKVSEELKNYILLLKGSEKQLRLIVDNVKDYAIIMLDPNGYIKTWNKGAEKIKGYSAKEIIGKHISIMYTEDEVLHKEPENNLKKAKEQGRFESEGWRVRKDGSKFFADVIYTALFDDNNDFQGFSKITRDITERRNAELEIKKKSEILTQINKELVFQNEEKEKRTTELITANELLERFIYIASHHLQEPLRTISNFVGLLEEEFAGKLNKDTSQYLEFILNASSKMQNLIRDLLYYSILGKQIKFEAIDCNNVLKEVIAEMDATIKESNAKITSTILPVIKGNEIQLKQLFQNLLINAIKFRKKNSIPEIEISVQEKDIDYVFAIKDNGIGIEEQEINKLFVIFKQLHNPTEYPGNGMGLAACKIIVARHNGKIWVESKPGVGSTFYFSLPKENLK